MKKILIFLIVLFSLTLYGQDPLRFEQEVKSLIADDGDVNKKDLILFTGSSSIRMWSTLKEDFPKHNVLNRGFGGSEMSDLLYYADQLIIPYQPVEIFIYEGDNDLSAGRSIDVILKNADALLSIIRTKLPENVKVVFISAKPSISRWALKEKYLDFNKRLEAWTKTKPNVFFKDVWTPMLDGKGELQKDLFIEDGLHMNPKGYKIWKSVIEKMIQ